jgi:hypothetical protein
MKVWTPREAIGKIVVHKNAWFSDNPNPAMSVIVFAGTTVRLGTGEKADITYDDLAENYLHVDGKGVHPCGVLLTIAES